MDAMLCHYFLRSQKKVFDRPFEVLEFWTPHPFFVVHYGALELSIRARANYGFIFVHLLCVHRLLIFFLVLSTQFYPTPALIWIPSYSFRLAHRKTNFSILPSCFLCNINQKGSLQASIAMCTGTHICTSLFVWFLIICFYWVLLLICYGNILLVVLKPRLNLLRDTYYFH